ncbi:F-box/LRR-repeat protein 15-like [Lutzomyia longipalpis]|uniref:F-box/LRR-repeat protein 15-like n=1 Tax=Lutzomyia longipalpis TaxID=7200 RepID=UPI0024843C74|nr:F-box/LRR-repeat protein 15-like [Lutzomyia longipalpis]
MVANDPESPRPLHILDLPVDDVIVPSIGQYLSPHDIIQLGQCSKEFHEIGLKMLRNMKVVYKNDQKMNGKWDSEYLKVCRQLRSMSLHSVPNLDNDLLSEIIRNNLKLEEISLRRASKITPTGLLSIVQLKNLTGLRLIKTYCDQYFLNVLNVCGLKLKYIYLSYDGELSLLFLKRFFRRQPKLEHIGLDFAYDGKETREDRMSRLGMNLNPLVSIIAKHCPELKYFVIERDSQRVGLDALSLIQKNCKNIQFIEVNGVLSWGKGQKEIYRS